ncbi:hypothetical protein [Vibrio owensii]|uniref:hypothetical protein n=1 Tax=Vibrio owensii TaxID=696485 RepID=UPI0038CEC08D
MSQPNLDYPFRTTYKDEVKDLPASRIPSASQRKAKAMRDRIEELKEQKAFEAMFGELGGKS